MRASFVVILAFIVMPFALYRWLGTIWPSVASVSFILAVLILADTVFNDLKLQADRLTALKETEWEYEFVSRYLDQDFSQFKKDLNEWGELNYQAVGVWTEPATEDEREAVVVLMKRPIVEQPSNSK
ncbi:MAG: hypothetical protein ACLQVL_22490 [Terriglobia bacterium]